MGSSNGGRDVGSNNVGIDTGDFEGNVVGEIVTTGTKLVSCSEEPVLVISKAVLVVCFTEEMSRDLALILERLLRG